jgi:Cro/C1-type HTH DNA-binding domain
MDKQINYYFSLGDHLKSIGITQVEARKRYGFVRRGKNYISRTNFQALCNRQSPRGKTLNILCNAMGVTPADLWRAE